MKLGWRMLLPLALGNIFLTGIFVLAVERASAETIDRLQWVGDVCNAIVALSIVAAILLLVIGLASPTTRDPRPPPFKPALKKRLPQPQPAAPIPPPPP